MNSFTRVEYIDNYINKLQMNPMQIHSFDMRAWSRVESRLACMLETINTVAG